MVDIKFNKIQVWKNGQPIERIIGECTAEIPICYADEKGEPTGPIKVEKEFGFFSSADGSIKLDKTTLCKGYYDEEERIIHSECFNCPKYIHKIREEAHETLKKN